MGQASIEELRTRRGGRRQDCGRIELAALTGMPDPRLAQISTLLDITPTGVRWQEFVRAMF